MKLKFLFKRPPNYKDFSPGTNITVQVSALVNRLAAENRTNCNHPDGRAENVAEHSFALSVVGPAVAEKLYPELDANLICRFATIHDTLEAYVGDTPTFDISEEGQRKKEELEFSAFIKMKKEFVHLPGLLHLVETYEAQVVPEARFIKVFDKVIVWQIHFSDKGQTFKREYTPELLKKHEVKKAADLRKNYPEFEDIITIREELVLLASKLFVR